MSMSAISAVIFVFALFLRKVEGSASDVNEPVKCCKKNLTECIEPVVDEADRTRYRNIFDNFDLTINVTNEKYLNCFPDISIASNNGNYPSIDFTKLSNCIEIVRNGSLTRVDCSNTTTKKTTDKCDSVMTPLKIYGASEMIFVNIVYLLPYTLVIILYLFIPSVGRRTYDKAVLHFTISQAILNVAVVILGHFLLCHKSLSNESYSFFGLTMMISTIAGVLWLLVISFEVSSTITKFRWAPSNSTTSRDKSHKFYIYLLLVSVGSIVPTAVSAILQFSPISDDFILKPNFHIINKLNCRVIAHVATIPILSAIASNSLFIYTTIKMINIQKSMTIANENRKKNMKAKYILFLKLYLLMDAPYITGTLGAMFKNLWILKFFRMLHPFFMLHALLPRDIVTKVLLCKRKATDNKVINALQERHENVEKC